MIKLDLRLEGKAILNRYIKAKPVQIARASRVATNRTLTRIKADVGAAIPKATGTSVAGFKRVRTKKRNVTVKRNNVTGLVWMGLNKIPAAYAGRLRSVKGVGAYAGRHFFKGAHIKQMRSGYRSLWKFNPVTGKRVQMYVDVKDGDKMAREALERSRPFLAKMLNERLKIEIEKGIK